MSPSSATGLLSSATCYNCEKEACSLLNVCGFSETLGVRLCIVYTRHAIRRTAQPVLVPEAQSQTSPRARPGGPSVSPTVRPTPKPQGQARTRYGFLYFDFVLLELFVMRTPRNRVWTGVTDRRVPGSGSQKLPHRLSGFKHKSEIFSITTMGGTENSSDSSSGRRPKSKSDEFSVPPILQDRFSQP